MYRQVAKERQTVRAKSEWSDFRYQRVQDCFLFTGRICAKSKGGVQGWQGWVILCSWRGCTWALWCFVRLLCREKERGRALIFMPAWILMALSRWGGVAGKKGEGGQGSSCLLSVVFEWCYLIDRELTTRLEDHLPGDSSRNCNSRVGHLAKR